MTPTLPAETAPAIDLGFLDSVPKDLPESDGVPMETAWQRDQMFLAIDLLETNWKGKRFYCGGNMFIHYALEQVRRRKFLGPDFFVVNDVDHDRYRKYWAVWDEDGRYPNFILKLLSASTAIEDLTTKKDIYEQTFGTHEYVCYDPEKDELQGWRLQKRYRPIPLESGRIWCESLELWIGTWTGTFLGKQTTWLRFFDRAGNRLPTAGELEAARTESEAARASRAEKEAERLRQEVEALRQQLSKPIA